MSRELETIVSEMRAYGDRDQLSTAIVLHWAERIAALTASPQAAPEGGDAFAQVCDALGIGAQARTVSCALTSIGNLKRFADQLHAVEREFFMVPGERDDDFPDDEPEPECLLNRWGSTTQEYVEQFRAALARLASPQVQATKPAECANGCPPRTVCDYCQYAGGKGSPQVQGVEAPARATFRCRECGHVGDDFADRHYRAGDADVECPKCGSTEADEADAATPQRAPEGCAIQLSADDWNPYELLDVVRHSLAASTPAVIVERIDECLRQQKQTQRAAPVSAVRTMRDGATFRDYLDRLACGELAQADQMAMANMLDDGIDRAVDRFLAWRLPDDFFPDCYVSFDRESAKRNNGWPIGTNLLTAVQAKAMFQHCLASGQSGVDGLIDLGEHGELRNATVLGARVVCARADQVNGCTFFGVTFAQDQGEGNG
jgi:hypothetical protein